MIVGYGWRVEGTNNTRNKNRCGSKPGAREPWRIHGSLPVVHALPALGKWSLLRAAVVVLKLFQTPGDDVAGGRHGRKAIVGATDLQDLASEMAPGHPAAGFFF